MSFQVDAACYPTAAKAAQVAASKNIGAVVSQGGTLYVVDAASSTDTTITYTLTPAAPGASISVASPFTAQPCNMLELSDGFAIGWLIAAAWLAAYGLLALKNALSGWGDQHGNT